MKLIHYTDKEHPLKEITYREQSKDHFKPTGFWVSDEDEFGWSAWCKDAGFNLGGLDLSYSIVLAENNNVLILNTADEVKAFSSRYTKEKFEAVNWYLNWPQIRERYDGVIITPHQWEIRLELEVMWYNTWDCAGGCIWNPKAIERFDTCQMSS